MSKKKFLKKGSKFGIFVEFMTIFGIRMNNALTINRYRHALFLFIKS